MEMEAQKNAMVMQSKGQLDEGRVSANISISDIRRSWSINIEKDRECDILSM